MTTTFSARRLTDPAGTATQCALVPVFSDKELNPVAAEFDRVSNGAISATRKLGDFTGKGGEYWQLPGAGRVKRILLLGCGEREKFDRKAARELCQLIYRALNGTKAREALLHGADLQPKDGEPAWLYAYLARCLVTGSYRYSRTVAKPKPPLSLAKLAVNGGEEVTTRAVKKALDQGAAIAAGINEARELADLPGNICTPSFLASRARRMARDNAALHCKVLDEKRMRELGMGSLLSVAAGSEQPAKLILLEYTGTAAEKKPYILVGKGITFDSGGISIKPAAKMDEMKFDMGGAASVFGTLTAVSALGLPINVVGIVAAAENMPGSRATKPGDVVTSMSGKTIEVLNTDAEGRLVLADALTYAARYKPAAVVDIATLTGACVVALGSHASGLYANRDELAEQLLAAGQESDDRAWRMPLWEEYQSALNSNFADMANVGGSGGGSITAACFLSRFVEDLHWAHLDIAGTAWDSSPKGASGRPVALLTRYLMDRAGR